MSHRLSHRLTAQPRRVAAIGAAAALLGTGGGVAVAATHGAASPPASAAAGHRGHHRARIAQSPVPETAVLVLPDGTRQDFGTDVRGCLTAPVPAATRPVAPSHHDLQTGPHCVISGG
jgi:hypothetical protein